MYKYYWINSVKLPTYGTVIILGLIIANFLAWFVIKKNQLSFRQFLHMEFIGGLGAIAGANFWIFLESFCTSIIKMKPLIFIRTSGFSYYGGLFCFLLFIYFYGISYEINIKKYEDNLTFLLPFLHIFWKIGCYLGGCCIGVSYTDLGITIYSDGVNKFSGTEYFPIQLVESITAAIICIALIVIRKKNNKQNQIAVYLQLYGATRFIIEFFRFHEGHSVWSFSHIMSCICFLIGFCINKKRCKNA